MLRCAFINTSIANNSNILSITITKKFNFMNLLIPFVFLITQYDCQNVNMCLLMFFAHKMNCPLLFTFFNNAPLEG